MAAHLNACGVDSLIHSIPHSTDKLTTPWRKKNIEKRNKKEGAEAMPGTAANTATSAIDTSYTNR